MHTSLLLECKGEGASAALIPFAVGDNGIRDRDETQQDKQSSVYGCFPSPTDCELISAPQKESNPCYYKPPVFHCHLLTRGCAYGIADRLEQRNSGTSYGEPDTECGCAHTFGDQTDGKREPCAELNGAIDCSVTGRVRLIDGIGSRKSVAVAVSWIEGRIQRISLGPGRFRDNPAAGYRPLISSVKKLVRVRCRKVGNGPGLASAS